MPVFQSWGATFLLSHLLCCIADAAAKAVVDALENAAKRVDEADRLRHEAEAAASAAGRVRDMQAKQLASANAMVADLHAQVTRLERDSGDAVRVC
jgi:hypothetical protein